MLENEIVLLRRFAETGDAEAFSEIVRRHAGLVYGVCLRVLEDKNRAADVVQETFLQLLRQAGEITGSVSGWLHRVAARKAIDVVRREGRRRKREARYAATKGRATEKWNDISEYVDEALDELDEQSREILIQHFFEGRTTTDIANEKGISQPTVSRRIESGVAELRTRLHKRGILVAAAALGSLLAQNAVEAAPVLVLKELGKIALVGGEVAAVSEVGGAAVATGTGAKVVFGSVLAAAKAKIIVAATVVVVAIGGVLIHKHVTRSVERSRPNSVASTVPVRKPVKNASTASELLEKFAENQDKVQSYIITATTWCGYERRRDGQDGKGKVRTEIELRFDGSRRRFCYRHRMWMDEPWQGHNTPRNRPEYHSFIRDGDIWIDYVTASENEPGSVSFRIGKSAVEKMFKQNLSRGLGVPALRGFFVGDDERIDIVLRDATKISLRERTERIGGSPCRVIDAETNRGDYTIWIDPRHGYNIAKAHVRIEAGDLFYGDYRLRKGERISGSLENVRFRLVNDRWIPVQADVFEIRETLPVGEGLQSKVHYKLKDVILNPNHDSLGSFVPDDITDGSRVHLNGGEYKWQNGKVVDAQGRKVDYKSAEPGKSSSESKGKKSPGKTGG